MPDTHFYRYDDYDRSLVSERVDQFRDQVRRRLAGELTEEQFKPLRLHNGLYLQLHAYMLRIAIPYGTLSSRQLRKLADISRKYDRGYGHFTTRQNLQLNWIKLEDAPDALQALAEVDMHALQTSGNCIRNVTADHFAGAAADEIEDPRIWAEIVRQWSTLHPEFTFLPRKFKIAITGSPNDRAAVRVHDIGLRLWRNDQGEVGFEVIVGGGLGRTPMIGKTLREFLPKNELLAEITRLAPPATELQSDAHWQDFRAEMVSCRDMHRRNALLIERQLEAIRGTLQSLRVEDAASPVEVYDRLGQIARFSRGGRGYNEA